MPNHTTDARILCSGIICLYRSLAASSSRPLEELPWLPRRRGARISSMCSPTCSAPARWAATGTRTCARRRWTPSPAGGAAGHGHVEHAGVLPAPGVADDGALQPPSRGREQQRAVHAQGAGVRGGLPGGRIYDGLRGKWHIPTGYGSERPCRWGFRRTRSTTGEAGARGADRTTGRWTARRFGNPR